MLKRLIVIACLLMSAPAAAEPEAPGGEQAAPAASPAADLGLWPWSRFVVDEIPYTEAKKLMDGGDVTDVVLRTAPDYHFFLRTSSGQVRLVNVVPSEDFMKWLLNQTGFRVSVDRSKDLFALITIGFVVLFNLALVAFFLVVAEGQIRTFFDNPAKRAVRASKKDKPVTFDDVAGIDHTKRDVEEVVEFLRDPRRFEEVGARRIKGVLMSGPPGTGKTLLAKAIAGEAMVPFYSVSGSEFVEMFVGLGARRVRKIFGICRQHPACILFIDEIDAIGGRRGSVNSHDERDQTLNQLLVEMDGIGGRHNIVVIAATNRPEMLDPALTRPGRFDRHVVVQKPDAAGREAILKVHSRDLALEEDVDLAEVARMTPGHTGAELAQLLNEAAMLAARGGRRSVCRADISAARDKLLMGEERPSTAVGDDERRVAAYHEAGHALAAVLSPHSDPVHKISIVPRGHALGVVIRLPEKDRVMVSRQKLEADLVVAMAGRAAEELVFGDGCVTTGAVADIETATALCREMAGRWGMFPELGKVCYLPSSSGARSLAADATMARLDEVVRQRIDAAYETASALLRDNRDALEALAAELLRDETVDGPRAAELVAKARDGGCGPASRLGAAAE